MTHESIKQRYVPVEALRWIHVNGRTASVYGAVPYTSAADKTDWSMQQVGWTVRNTFDGTVGLGMTPFKTQEDAQAFCDAKNLTLFLNHAYSYVVREYYDSAPEARVILAQWRPETKGHRL